jgi:hypothetical protein
MLIHNIWQSHWPVLTLVDAFTICIFLIAWTGMATIRQAIFRSPVYKPDIRFISEVTCTVACETFVIVLQLSSWLSADF